MSKDRFKIFLCLLVCINIIVLACVSVYSTCEIYDYLYEDTALVSAFAQFPNGSLEYKEKENAQSKPKIANNTNPTQASKKIDSVQGSGTKYIVEEMQISSDLSYNNFSVKNSTSYSIDYENMLNSELPFEIEDTRKVQVLIVHTHTCESYMNEDAGYYFEDFYPRTTDNEKNVTKVGEAIAKKLKENGIGVVHIKTQHDNPSYDGAYYRSYDTIMKYIEKYKDIKVVLDIHRDSMTKDDMTKIKPTFTYKGHKAAQIMIMSGHDDGDGGFPMWEENLNFALKLQDTAETMYPGITRPLNFGYFTYNMNVNSGSLLIEVGTDANTLEEAVYTGQMLGNALAQVLQK